MRSKSLSYDPELTKLATNFSVHDYKAARDKAAHDAESKNKIADAILLRFMERYIKPATDPSCKHGFTMMAISCLMIEALESLRRGWPNSNNKSEAAFCYFFNGHTHFTELRAYCEQFYKHVRCGILHQAETTGGWKITRNKKEVPFFDSKFLTINAQTFLDNLSEVLKEFCAGLKKADWESKEWKNVVKKMNALCANCRQSGR